MCLCVKIIFSFIIILVFLYYLNILLSRAPEHILIDLFLYILWFDFFVSGIKKIFIFCFLTVGIYNKIVFNMLILWKETLLGLFNNYNNMISKSLHIVSKIKLGCLPTKHHFYPKPFLSSCCFLPTLSQLNSFVDRRQWKWWCLEWTNHNCRQQATSGRILQGNHTLVGPWLTSNLYKTWTHLWSVPTSQV